MYNANVAWDPMDCESFPPNLILNTILNLANQSIILPPWIEFTANCESVQIIISIYVSLFAKSTACNMATNSTV